MPQPQPWVKGPIEAVPCPRCGQPNDFTEIDEQLGKTDLDSSNVTGQVVLCDHCNQKMQVVGVRVVTEIAVRSV